MNLNDMIYRRKSVRSYEDASVDDVTIQKIKEFSNTVKPFYPDIKVSFDIVDRHHVKCLLPWTTSQLIAVFSEEKDGYLENVGFMFQQLELYMQSIGLGVCWLGMGRMNSAEKNNGLQFVITLAFGYPKGTALRSNVGEFKRKSLSEISDITDERLEPARLAPSSVNSQPWYFVHDGNMIHAYCVKPSLLKIRSLENMNRIDMGICLAHMYVANEDKAEFFKAENVKQLKQYNYLCSFIL